MLTAEEREQLIGRYADGPRRLREAFSRVAPEAIDWRPGEKKWSAHEVVVHCADSESNAYARIRFLLAEPSPVIMGYDQAGWADTLNYQNQPVELSFAVVDAVRGATTALLRSLPEEAWQKTGRHTESGEYSTEKWLKIYADHVEGHSRQIERNIEAWNNR